MNTNESVQLPTRACYISQETRRVVRGDIHQDGNPVEVDVLLDAFNEVVCTLLEFRVQKCAFIQMVKALFDNCNELQSFLLKAKVIYNLLVDSFTELPTFDWMLRFALVLTIEHNQAWFGNFSSLNAAVDLANISYCIMLVNDYKEGAEGVQLIDTSRHGPLPNIRFFQCRFLHLVRVGAINEQFSSARVVLPFATRRSEAVNAVDKFSIFNKP